MTDTEPEILADLSRHAERVSDDLHALVEKCTRLGWQPDAFSLSVLAETASAIGGMGIRVALASGDAGEVSRAMGRPFKELTIDDALNPDRKDTT